MGLAESFLSRPVEEKFSEDDSNGKMCYGASSMQGWRMRQEVIKSNVFYPSVR